MPRNIEEQFNAPEEDKSQALKKGEKREPDKIKDLPNGESFMKKDNDIKKLTEIENKINKNKEPTEDQLRFIYKTEFFDYEKYSRIEKIKEKRDQRKDYTQIFNCKPEQVALSIDELNENITIFGGSLDLKHSQLKKLSAGAGLTHIVGAFYLESSQLTELPAGLTYIRGNFNLQKSQITELPTGLTHIGGNLELISSQITELPDSLTHIGGSLYLENSQLKELPASLTHIGENLNLEKSQLTELPADLSIGRDVYVDKNSKIDFSKVKIGGKIIRR